jgi:hypothetical protein
VIHVRATKIWKRKKQRENVRKGEKRKNEK